MTHIARREFLASLLFASVQSIVPASMQGASGRKSSAPGLDENVALKSKWRPDP
jgi:hypothetical protein